MYKRVHRRLRDVLASKRAWIVALTGAASLAFSAQMHNNPWHLLALLLFALAFLLLVGISRTRHSVSKPWLTLRAGDLVERAAAALIVAGTFLPFMTLAMRGEVLWCELGLAGAILTLMLAMDMLFESSRMALAVTVRIGALWGAFYLARHHFIMWHPRDITIVMIVGLLVSVSIAWEAIRRRKLSSWKAVAASIVVSVPHVIESLLQR